MRTFSTEFSRDRIKDAADCMLEARSTLQTIVRRFPAQAQAFHSSLEKLEAVYNELSQQAATFEPERPTASTDISGSPKVKASCQLSA